MSQNDTPERPTARLDLAFDPGREVAQPREAATVLILREAPVPGGELEIFCVVRHKKSGFLGGALVFPGGKIDEADALPAWVERAGGLPPRSERVASSDAAARALSVGAARETLEEAGVLPLSAPLAAAEIAALRSELAAGQTLLDVLERRGAALDTAAFVPFARWVTPEAEPRRFDTRFYLLPLPAGQEASNDGHETTDGFWATPAAVLERFLRDEVQLAPPTTRCLELLSGVTSFARAVEIAAAQSLEPICPRFVPGDPPFLALPGDPAHEVTVARVPGPTRFVLRDGRFVSEAPS